MSIIVETPFQNFTGLDGKPLTNGKVYIGQVGTDPTVFANQIPVFWDEALTIPASQPLTTAAGYIVRTGTPARVWVATDYSISVKNASNILVYYIPEFGAVDYVSASDLASSSGASLVGYIQGSPGSSLRTITDKLREAVSITDFYADGISGLKVDPTGVIDSTAGIQSALNNRGRIYIPPGTYKVSSTIIIYGNTELYGAGIGVSILSWAGSTTGYIIQDSSMVTSTDINLNIILRDFEISGNSYSSNALGAIRMYRVGKIKYERLYMHDVGGTLLLWGQSQADTVDVQIIGCIFSRAFNGDACQGVGQRVVVRDCYAFSAGDTCYALVFDTNSTTNPSNLYSSNIVFENCIAKGEYNSSGVFTGVGRAAQGGFAIGPFNVGVNAYVTISNCLCENLFTNMWFIVFNKLKLINNTFKPHANTTTGGLRLDGNSGVVIKGNSFECTFAASGGNYGAVFFNAQRNSFGASNFDSSNNFTVLDGNTFENNSTPGIVCSIDTTYSLNITDMVVSNNVFSGVTLPISFKPLTSSGSNIFNNISLMGNTVNSSATAFVTANGSASQYGNISISDNILGNVPLVSGATDTMTLSGSTTITTPGVLGGTATTVFTIPAIGSRSLQIDCRVSAANPAYSAIANIVTNAGVARIAWKSDGVNCVITLAGNAVQVSQSGIGTQTVYSTVKYLS